MRPKTDNKTLKIWLKLHFRATNTIQYVVFNNFVYKQLCCFGECWFLLDERRGNEPQRNRVTEEHRAILKICVNLCNFPSESSQKTLGCGLLNRNDPKKPPQGHRVTEEHREIFKRYDSKTQRIFIKILLCSTVLIVVKRFKRYSTTALRDTTEARRARRYKEFLIFSLRNSALSAVKSFL